MAGYRRQEMVCAKCAKRYFEEENIGALQCYDTFYTSDHLKKFVIAADHRFNADGNFKYSLLKWEDWVWGFNDNIHIEKTLFEKLPQQPHAKSIVDIGEYDKRKLEYINHMRINTFDSEKISPKETEFFTEKLQDDNESFSFSSGEDSCSDEENVHYVPLQCSSVVKKVCVARFDWREKFVVLRKIHEYDCNLSKTNSKKDMTYEKYWTTLEYAHNPDIVSKFKKRKIGLF